MKLLSFEQLLSTSLPVPPFCVIPYSFCERFLGSLPKEFFELEESDFFARQQIFWKTPLPEELKRDLFLRLSSVFPSSKLLKGIFAVRFVGEGSLEGETMLGLRGEEGLIEAIKNGWASMITTPLSFKDASFSLVVQEMVMATRSVLLFTSDPFRPCLHQGVAYAGYGLGEGFFERREELDSFSFDETGELLSQKKGQQQTQKVFYARRGAGIIEESLSPHLLENVSLTAAELKELVVMGQKAEKLFHETPCSLLFSYREGGWVLLSVAPLKEFAPHSKIYPLKVWSQSVLPDAFQGETTPLSASFFKVYWSSFRGTPLLFRYHRPYGFLTSCETSFSYLKIPQVFFHEKKMMKKGPHLLWLLESLKGESRPEKYVESFKLVLNFFSSLTPFKKFFQMKERWNHFFPMTTTIQRGMHYDLLQLALWICGDEEVYSFISTAEPHEIGDKITDWPIFYEHFKHFTEKWGGDFPFYFKLEVKDYRQNPLFFYEELKKMALLSAHELQRQLFEYEKEEKDSFLQKINRYFLAEEDRFSHLIQRIYSELRRILGELGDVLVALEFFQYKEQIFFLTIEELISLLQGEENHYSFLDLIKVRQSTREISVPIDQESFCLTPLALKKSLRVIDSDHLLM